MVNSIVYPVSANYDRTKNQVYIQLYDTTTHKIVDYYMPDYKFTCLTDSEEIAKNHGTFEIVAKYDALHDVNRKMFKVTFKNPEEIKATQDEFTETVKVTEEETITVRENHYWENYIDPAKSCVYDYGIQMGMPYQIVDGKLQRLLNPDAEGKICDLITRFEKENHHFVDERVAKSLLSLFEYIAPKYKRCAVDIEVKNPKKRVPSPDLANFPVIAVCIKTSEGRRIAFMLLRPDKDFKEYPNVDELHVYTDEKQLIKEVIEFLLQYPFILTFNGDGFDLPYLLNRGLRFDLPEESMPFKVMGKDPIFQKVYMRNNIHIDLNKFFKITAIKNYAFGGKYKDVGLNTLGQAFLKRGKLNEDKRDVGDLSYVELINYCMRDAEITYDLSAFDDDQVMNLITTISRISKLPMEVVSRKMVGSWIESFLLDQHRQQNYLIPHPEDIIELKGKLATTAMIKGKKYEGALVIDPITGVFFDMIVGDYGSLYPSIIKLHNIGYSTICCNHEECKANRPNPKLPHWICLKHKAMESIFIGTLRDLRLYNYKKLGKTSTWYKVVEQTIKVFMNASYGVFSSEGKFAFKCPIASEEIASIAKETITATVQHAKEMGMSIVGGDTDSLFLHEHDMTRFQQLQDWCKQQFGIEFELDKKLRFMAFSNRKKNYLGVYPDGSIDIKGMTGKKKHTPKFFKGYFEQAKIIISGIQNENDVTRGKKELSKLAHDAYKRLQDKKWDNLSDLAYHVTANKDPKLYTKTVPQHIKAVRQYQLAGFPYEVGTTVDFVKTWKREGVIPLELAKNSDIDIEKYKEQLQTIFQQLLDPFEIDWDERVLGKTKLTSFLSM